MSGLPRRRHRSLALWVVGACCACPSLWAFEPGRASFSIRANGETIPYRVFAISVLPGQAVRLETVGPSARELHLLDGHRELAAAGPGSWVWMAPGTPGLHRLEILDRQSGGSIQLNVLVMVPASRVSDGYLNGYRIGSYPPKPFRNLTVYRPPRGFVEVRGDAGSIAVSPHFTLGQFLCKQAGGEPRYLVLRERLLLKLEHLLELVNGAGYRAETFNVLSGFRTPYYNRAIGNVPNSRHQWGGAADIFIDEHPRDDWMDDLNGDGRIDVADANVLYQLFERVSTAAEFQELTGGHGLYGTTASHGPFVHVDARGYRARWGAAAQP